MGNLLQKTIASALCLSFFMTQATFANQMTGTVLNNVGTGGADIESATKGFTGFQNGGILGLDKNKATLNFNGDAIINWGHLNVGGNQSLTFNNDTHVVLNNVLNGMSTFAGTITGQQGHIIISNPNGIMMQGGRFETAGALTLTTKDLSNIKLDADGKFHNLTQQIDDAKYKDDNNAVIVFKNGNWTNAFRDTYIEAGDINIISKGIDISKAELVAKTGNVVFKTTDGATFVAEKANQTFGTNFKDGNTIQVANASIKTNGTIQFVTKGAGNISVASVKTPNSYSFKTENGNVSIVSANNSVKVANSDINGNLNVKGKLDVPNNWDDLWNLFKGNSDVLGDIEITDSKITGTSTLQTLGNIVIENCKEIGNLVAESTFRGIKVGNSDIKGNADFKVTGKTYDILPYYNIKEGKWIDSVYVAPKGGVVASNTNIGGTINLDVKNNANFSSPEGTLNFANPNVGGKLIATADNISFKKDGGLTINDAFNAKYKLNATKDLTFKTDSILTAIDQIFTSEKTNFIAGNKVALTNVDTKGKITAKADNIDFTQNGKDLTINNKFNEKYSLSADNNLTFNTNKNITVENQTFASKFTNFIAGNKVALTNVDTKGKITAKADNIDFTQNGKDLTIDNVFNNKYKLNATGELSFKTDSILTAIDQIFTSEKTNFIANDINLTNVDTVHQIYAEGKNIAFKQDGGLTINDAFNAKYKLNATDELSFKTDGDLIANSNNVGFGTANSTKFEGKNVNLKDITTNAINVVAKNGKIVAENVTAKVKDISNNIVARFEGNEVTSTNSNYQGEILVNASNNATFESSNNLTFANGSSVANQFKADSTKDITINDMDCNKIQAKGKNVTLNKSSNLTINKNNINLVASEDVNVNADGILNVIESTIEGNNINLNANEIASTDAIYAGNVKMDSKGGITFNKDNSIAGTLTAKANNDINFRGITRADSDVTVDTTANATVHNVEVKNGTLAINNARNISVNNCSSDKLAIVNTPDNKFDYAEIYNTYAGTTEFGHGKYLYIDLTQSNLYRNNIKAILDNAYNVDKIVFNPMSAIYGQESSKNMNNLRAKGINTNIEQNFAPIAFAANENYKNSSLFKVAGDKVFKDLEKVVHITDKFILD